MAAWAAAKGGRHTRYGPDDAQFLCVCVESESVARYFHRSYFEGTDVVNCYIPSSRYMPRGYGQLGCSGFIISDSEGRFVSRRTSAYLQRGEAAFRHVESILDGLLREEAEKKKKETEKAQGVAPKKQKMSRGDGDDEEEKQDEKQEGNPNDAADKAVGEEKKDEGKEEEQKRADRNDVVEAPPSVGVESMDREHEECAASFNRLFADPTAENLEELCLILAAHFKHEEDLMAQHGMGSNGSGGFGPNFSAAASHKADHDRILAIATAELSRVRDAEARGRRAVMSCSGST